jgi:hypothetical protein
MTKSNWQPTSWLAMVIASIPCFKWENVQPDNVATRMPDLMQRLNGLATGNLSRARGAISRNYASEPRLLADHPVRPSDSDQHQTDRTRPNF